MLPAVPRKKGALRAKVNHKEDGAGPGPSSGRARQSHGPMHGGRGVHSQGNGTPSGHRQAESRCAPDGQRRNPQPARRGRPPSRRPVASPRAVGTSSDTTACEYNGAYWNSTLWRSQEPASDTATSDEEGEYSNNSAVQEEPASASAASSSSVADGGVQVDYAASDRSVDDLTQRTLAGSKSPSERYVDELAALLDPNQPPSVVLTFHGFRDELGHMPSVEDYLRVDPTIRPVGESTDDDSSDTSPLG